LPIILLRTPYNKDSTALTGHYINNGFIMVVQDTRGFYCSEGVKGVPFGSDQNDGHDTISWLENQPWCNKKIGTIGASALGITQYLLAPNAPSSLKCQVPVVGTPDLYSAIYIGGELRKELMIPWMQATGYTEEEIDYVILNEKLSAVWDPVRIIDQYDQIHAASLHFGGWYDIFAQDTINGFMGYQYEGGIGAQGNAKLIMGPWLHGNFYGTPTGEIRFPNQDLSIAANAQNAVLDKWLKNNSLLWDQYPTVLYYLMSSVDYNIEGLGNHWYQSDIWPIPFNVSNFYLDSSGGLNTSSSDSGYNEVEWDAGNVTTTIGGNNLVIAAGMYDQSSLENRNDVLLYTTAALTEAVTTVGSINITLYVSSNCTDTDFTVKLTDVYPDGRSMLITDSILRMRNRNSLSTWEFMNPGTVYEITLSLVSTAYVFNVGHQIRLAISGSNFPRFEGNPNTGDALWQNSTYYTSQNRIYCNTTYPSMISLPTPDYESLQTFVY
jgi:putative CocE/NonD family hydrolase